MSIFGRAWCSDSAAYVRTFQFLLNAAQTYMRHPRAKQGLTNIEMKGPCSLVAAMRRIRWFIKDISSYGTPFAYFILIAATCACYSDCGDLRMSHLNFYISNVGDGGNQTSAISTPKTLALLFRSATTVASSNF